MSPKRLRREIAGDEGCSPSLSKPRHHPSRVTPQKGNFVLMKQSIQNKVP